MVRSGWRGVLAPPRISLVNLMAIHLGRTGAMGSTLYQGPHRAHAESDDHADGASGNSNLEGGKPRGWGVGRYPYHRTRDEAQAAEDYGTNHCASPQQPWSASASHHWFRWTIAAYVHVHSCRHRYDLARMRATCSPSAPGC